jgi:hypothetical protein
MTAPHLGHDTAPGKRALGDDMVDSSKWLSSETLGEALRFCQEQLSADYQNLDWWARFWQKGRGRPDPDAGGEVITALMH